MDEARKIALSRTRSKQAKEFSKILTALGRHEIRAQREKISKEALRQRIGDNVTRSPTTLAYTSYLIREAATSSFQVTLAALAACPRLYLKLGRTYRNSKGSSHPVYGKWLSIYTSTVYVNWVNSYTRILNASAKKADSETLDQMLQSYATSCIYEWMFLEAAYSREEWPNW